MNSPSDIETLKAENKRLIDLLEEHGIAWQQGEQSIGLPSRKSIQSHLTPPQKVNLFRELFRGRNDVFPIRWESKSTGKSGYSPACDNEWRPGVCEKPRIKCSDCDHRLLTPVTDKVIYDHLAGVQTVGVYPLQIDNSCVFLAVDFDDADWKADVQAYARSCEELDVPVVVEVSRSGNGAHAWVFFSSSVAAADARRLGTAILSYTCSRTRQLQLKSYDRLFPNQDTMPKGGFGNLIALPLQKPAREKGCSVFVDSDLHPFPDQWAFLESVKRMDPFDIESTILQATGGNHPLDVTFIDNEDLAKPWVSGALASNQLAGAMPSSVKITFANLLYFEKSELPQSLANRLIRLAAFQNPDFYKAQAMRLSTWDKPRVIGCAENYPNHIALPRGCYNDVVALLDANNIKREVIDERFVGESIDVNFHGTLRLDQEAAVSGMLSHETGVLCAPTAFGKTITAAAMIARRNVNTLILVHRSELLRQWQEQLGVFLDVDKGDIGAIGGGKSTLKGKIDIALMQTISRQGDVKPLVENYGLVIVDECHHVGAVSFEAILKRIKAKYVFGLTATPIRRDGKQPIIFMGIGPVRYTASRPTGAPQDLEVRPRLTATRIDMPPDSGIQDVFRYLVNDENRTKLIASEIIDSFKQGRKVLVLTERTDHLDSIFSLIHTSVPALFVLHGRIPKKQRAATIAELDSMASNAPRVVIATGKLVGEGFDHPPLDTLIMTMPVSWKGTLQQYAGRLHRECAEKTSVRIIDFLDVDHPALLRMWEKRKRGYLSMGYRINEAARRS